MSEVILDTLIDSIKLVPFLFLTYLAMEYLEHKAGEKTTHMVRKAGKMGPLIGGVAGVLQSACCCAGGAEHGRKKD